MCMIDDMFFFGRLHEPRNHRTAAYNYVFFLGCYCSMNVITHVQYYFVLFSNVSLCHRGGRIQKINAWYLNTHMVYL
jgi:hypothetical protein